MSVSAGVCQAGRLRRRVPEGPPRDASLELAREQSRRGALETRLDRDAARRETTRELGRPFGRDLEIARHTALQLEGIAVQRALDDLSLRRDGAQELLLDRRQRVVGDNDVRRDTTTAVHHPTSVGTEHGTSLARRISLERVRMRLDETAVREQLSIAVNGATTGRIPLARRHLQEIAAIERKHGLNESLAEARRADDERAIVILQCTSDDLRR
jgi:hypothetical protein